MRAERLSILAGLVLLWSPLASGQTAAPSPPQQSPLPATPVTNYRVGPRDVLAITSYDQPDLTGKFTIEADGTFTYPLIGRVRAGDMTLREIEVRIEGALKERGFFVNPEVAVSIDSYRSQKVFVVGEVKTPGAYPLSGDMRLVEALALAGSTLATSSGEAVVVHGSGEAAAAAAPGGTAENVSRVDLRLLETGDPTQNVPLKDGDTVFVLRAESIYVFGQVRNPGAYPLRQKATTVLQALALAGGVVDRGSTGRVQIIRIVDGKRVELRAGLTDLVLPRDTVVVPERFF